jgi:hypothetical protein
MKTICLIIALLAAGTVGAQSISPILTECGGKKCAGQFTATNVNLNSEVVTIRAVSWRPGQPTTELDPKIHLTLRDMSARLGPKGSHIFFFNVQCDALPCWFGLYATFAPLRTQDTTQVGIAMSLPHAVWICDKAKDCRATIRKSWGVQ